MHRNDRLIILLGLFVTIIALVGAAIGGRPKVPEGESEEVVDYTDLPIVHSPQKTLKGNSQEFTDQMVNFNVSDEYVISVNLELHWKDESNAQGLGRYQNQPDGFNFTVYTPWGEVIESESRLNEINIGGVIEETIMIPTEGIKDTAMGKWDVNIHCDNCGDQEPTVNVVGARDIADTGNAWVLIYIYEFHSSNE